MTLTLRNLPYRSVLAVLLLPSLLLIGVSSYYPAVRSLIGGFYQWNGFSPPTYAGVSQFKEYIQSPTFGIEAKNIVILTGGSILITLVSQFTAAEIVMHMPRRAGNIAKYVLVLPIVLPPLVLIEVWAYLFQPGSGLIDKTFGLVGLPQPTWISDPHIALLSILLIGFPWISNLGFLIFLGGLLNIPGLSSLVPSGKVGTVVDVVLDDVLSTAATNSGLRLVQGYIDGQLSFDAFSTLWQSLLTSSAQQWATANHVDLSKY